MVKKLYIRLVAILLLAGLVLALPSPALATSADRMSLCNLEGRPGETIEAQITLGGTDAEERSGYWEIYYKAVAGDDERMDITSWITIEPEEYTITQGQTITFTVRIKIPANGEPGLWGATSEDAGQPGQSALRRTYLIFKDTPTGGNVYSGLLIPVSVKVLAEPSPPAPLEQASPLAPILSYIQDNIIIVALGVIIIILLILLLARTTARRTG
jgi:hypothetical protein